MPDQSVASCYLGHLSPFARSLAGAMTSAKGHVDDAVRFRKGLAEHEKLPSAGSGC